MSSLDHSLQKFGGPDLLGTAVVLNRSELFRAECKRLISETNKARKRIQDVESKHLGKYGGGGGEVGGGLCSGQKDSGFY